MEGLTFLKKVHETDVYVNSDGKFVATLPGKRHQTTLANLRELEKRIAQESGVGSVQVMRKMGYGLQVVEFLGRESNGRIRLKGFGLQSRWHQIYELDEALIAEFKALADEREAANVAFEERTREIEKRLKKSEL